MGWIAKRNARKKKTHKGKATPAGQTSSPPKSPPTRNRSSERTSVDKVRSTAHIYQPEEVKELVSKNRYSTVLGIDLGTTNCVMATIIGNSLLIIPDAEGQTITPSVFALSDSGEYLTGWAAKRQATLNPQNTICSVKRLLACKYEDSTVQSDRKWAIFQISKSSGGDAVVEIGNEKFDPREILAVLLRKLKIDAEVYLGQEVAEVVITIPAYFSHRQRQATKDAATIAGFDVLRIIHEPTAAALAYGLTEYDDETVAICHLGGGTFDISILELGEGTFQVKSINGDTHLGGVDFSNRVIDWVCDEFKKEHGINLRQDKIALQRINEAVEKAKCELSFITQSEIDIPHITGSATETKHLNIMLTRSKLEQLVEDLIQRTEELCKQALSDAGIKSSQIDNVIFIGGQTKMPLVQQKIREIFGSVGRMRVVPDDFVASGAAIHGGVLKGDISDILLLDVTPHTLGIETLGSVMTTLIPRNTTIPTAKSQIFSTTADNQPSVEVHVLQGERAMAIDNETLGRFMLDGILPAPRGVPQIEVTFDIGFDGIVSVKAQDKGTGKERNITVTDSSTLFSGEMERMKKVVETCISTKGSKEIEVKDIDLNDIQNTVIQMPSVAGKNPLDPLDEDRPGFDNKRNEECSKFSDKNEKDQVTDVILEDVTPFTLGIESKGGEMIPLIPRHSTIPTSITKIFSTVNDNQSKIAIHMVQGEQYKAIYNKSLGFLIIDGILPAPKGTQQIEISFNVDANSVLNAQARDKEKGNEYKVEKILPDSLTEEQLKTLREEAELWYQEDPQKRKKGEVPYLTKSDTQPMKAKAISNFINLMKTGHTCSRIPIKDLAEYYNAIVQYLRDEGLTTSQELLDELETRSSLRGICPECNAWTDSSTIGMVSTFIDMGREKILFTNSSMDEEKALTANRLLNGLCQQYNCLCSEILLIWKDDPDIMNHIDDHLKKLDIINNQNMQQFLRPDINAYVNDSIFAMTTKSQPSHIYTGRKFSDTFVWISVLPPIDDVQYLQTSMFPQGYIKFLDGLLSKSKWEFQDIDVIHWTYIPHIKISALNLAFCSRKSKATKETARHGDFILPIDLLNNEERQQLGL